MYFLRFVNNKLLTGILLLVVLHINRLEAYRHEYTVDNSNAVSPIFRTHIVTLERQRRDTAAVPTQSAETSPPVSSPDPAQPSAKPDEKAATPANSTDDVNRTPKLTDKLPEPASTVTVTQTPLLGVNGSGIWKNLTENTPKVSDPITPTDEDLPDVFKETADKIAAEHNLTTQLDNHLFYNSSVINNMTYFNEYWGNISKVDATTHVMLSNSYRRATTMQLRFDFPFYGYNIRSVTVATGGFIFVGEVIHNWLAATQYIAPLMANFDTSQTNHSAIKLYDDAERLTVFWENVTLQENLNKTFTFAVTLYKTGEIVFAYKDMPIPVQDIADVAHPVKIGISDAYNYDNYTFLSRTKTIYEYHRVSFKNYMITNGSVLRLIPLPTCLQYNSCLSCINHATSFNCSWCAQTQKCSSGKDRYRHDWVFRQCEVLAITDTKACSASNTTAAKPSQKPETPEVTKVNRTYTTDNLPTGSNLHSSEPPQQKAIGGVVAAFIIVALIACFAGWVLYAFRYPHTRSGQLMIKYRPSQWSWRRGEARYTAATIHM